MVKSVEKSIGGKRKRGSPAGMLPEGEKATSWRPRKKASKAATRSAQEDYIENAKAYFYKIEKLQRELDDVIAAAARDQGIKVERRTKLEWDDLFSED